MSILFYHIVCIAFISLQLSKSDILWHYQVTNTDSIPSEWVFTTTDSGTVTPVSDSRCPQTTTCWQGYSSNKFNDWELTRTVQSTINYENILFSYQLSTYINKAGMFCNIEYTTDNAQNWNPITNIQGPTPEDPNAYISTNFSNWNPSPNNNPDGIQIRFTSTDTGIQGFRYCWFNELKLTADSLIPTTATPTTAIPTTFTPTTTIPTTTSPTTATPTTINPTTSQPTTAYPTTTQPTKPPGAPTAAPTLNPTFIPTNTPTDTPVTGAPTLKTTKTPTDSPITSTKEEQGNDNDGAFNLLGGDIVNYGLYGAIGLVVLFILICLFCYCKKKKQSVESQDKINQNLSTEMAVGSGSTSNNNKAPLTRVHSGSYDPDAPRTSKYSTKSIEENVKRTNTLPDNFWREESESREKHRVVSSWQEAGTNVVESEVKLNTNYDNQFKQEQKNNMQPVYETQVNQPIQHEPPIDLGQIFGRKANKEESDSDDESLMKKQHQYQDSYDPNAVVEKDESKGNENEELKANDSDDELLMKKQQFHDSYDPNDVVVEKDESKGNENEELKANEYITPGGDDIDLKESDDDENDFVVEIDDELLVDEDNKENKDDIDDNVLLIDEDEQKTDEYATPI